MGSTAHLVDCRFELGDLAGTGGMARVYRAVDTKTGRTVALKIIHHARVDDERLGREVQALERIEHPAVVRYVAHGITEQGLRYLAMEWLEGETLSERLKRDALSIEESIILGIRIAEALGTAHEAGLIHRDVKPQNIFLVDGKANVAKLLDFGLARATDSSDMLTMSGVVLGTPSYMAPEQARGERHLDARADVFALGAVLFECLTGRRAFLGTQAMSLLAKVALEETPEVHELRPDVPDGLGALVNAMLRKDPVTRPSHGLEVARALGRIEQGDDPLTLAEVIEPTALTPEERRVVTVVMARGTEEEQGTIEAGLKTHIDGARVVRLRNGATVLALSGHSARDLAFAGARKALALGRTFARPTVAMATGNAVVSRRLPMGEAIDEAAALLDFTVPDRKRHEPLILVDEVTAGLLRTRFEVRQEGDLTVLVAEREQEDHLLLGKPTPCVGRSKELRILDAIYDECVEEEAAQVALVTGPAGIGKSRLRHAFVERLRSREEAPQVWLGQGDPVQHGDHGLLAQALRRGLGLPAAGSKKKQREHLRRRVSEWLPPDDARRVTMFIAEVLGIPFPDSHDVKLRAARRDARVMGDQVARAFEDLIAAECGAAPLVLILEDLQWAGGSTLRLIDNLLRNRPELPLMIVALARPDIHEAFPYLWQGRHMQEIRLAELGRRASEKLLLSVFEREPASALQDRLIAQAGGNPLYLAELIRAHVEGHGDDAPKTVLALLQARVARLEPDARRVLRAASIFGHVFWPGGMVSMLGGKEGTIDVTSCLESLVSGEIIARRTESVIEGEDEYEFRHGLFRDAAYATLTQADRKLGHRLAACWLEEYGPDEPLPLAEHFEAGGEAHRAGPHFRRAAEEALAAHEFEEALRRAGRALACGVEGRDRAAIRYLEVQAYGWRSRYAEAEKVADQTLGETEAGSSLWFQMQSDLLVMWEQQGRRDDALRIGTMLLEREPLEDADPSIVLKALVRVALVARELADPGMESRARERVERRRATSGDDHDPFAEVDLMSLEADNHLSKGDLGAYLRVMRAVFQEYERLGAERKWCHATINLGWVLTELGRFEEAVSVLERMEGVVNRLGLGGFVLAAIQEHLGAALVRLRRWGQAERALRAASEGFQAHGAARLDAPCHAYLSELYAAQGHTKAALAAAKRAVDLAEKHSAVHLPLALSSLARVHLSRGDHENALGLTTRAIERLDALTHTEEGAARIRLTHAQALRAAGHLDAAREVITRAREGVLSVAKRIEEGPLRKSFLEGVHENAETLALAEAWVGRGRRGGTPSA